MLNNDDLEFDKAPEFLLGNHYFVGLFKRGSVNKSIEISLATWKHWEKILEISPYWKCIFKVL